MRFEWNDRKARGNLAKHGVSFEEASTVFDDPRRPQEFDLPHSGDEDCDVAIGFSHRMRLLMVVIYEKHEDGVIRIISARRATRSEGLRYFAES